MARINTTGSAYRVPRRKSEIARDEKWLKTAKLTAKKRRESKKPKPVEKTAETPEAGHTGPEAPDENRKPQTTGPGSTHPRRLGGRRYSEPGRLTERPRAPRPRAVRLKAVADHCRKRSVLDVERHASNGRDLSQPKSIADVCSEISADVDSSS